MNLISDYQLIEKLHESDKSVVYRGRCNEDNRPIVLKILKYPTTEDRARFRREYEINHSLDIEGVVNVYGIEKYQNSLAMIIEDFGGESLDRILRSRKLDLVEFLRLAIRVADVVSGIHQQNIMHKDINPSHIVWNPESEQIKIIGFSISTVLPRETPAIHAPNRLDGTLAYMSPEQTGRMNRAIDYRTDFYSLGVTFYQLLTGRLPFVADDAIELVYAHLALQPVPPHEYRPDVPPTLSLIILRLMAKNAEDRYQSALGLKADLERCLHQVETTGKIEPFTLGEQDFSISFQIPQKLYGCEDKITTLLQTYERICKGRNELLLVSGYAGTGKTRLIHEIQKPITRSRGYFIAGKFDQLQRSIPYSAFSQAFKSLANLIVSEEETAFAQWRGTIQTAVGGLGKVLTEVIPEIEMIIGQQPDVPELGPAEAQSRFNYVFGCFLQSVAQEERPLVLFLDDLQWADPASLRLLRALITDPAIGHMLVLGAYRDNEVDAAHPLTIALDEMGKKGARISRVHVDNLSLRDVTSLVGNTVVSNRLGDGTLSDPSELAGLVHQKTHGNALFTIQFLRTLYTEDLLTFDLSRRCWTWDIDQLKGLGITDNVVELLAGRVQRLSRDTREVLKLASCIGRDFDIPTLAVISERSEHSLEGLLNQTITENLVSRFGDSAYQFVHDRVQQAAYSLIAEEEKKAVHRRIGQLLLRHIPPEEQEIRLFEIVGHLNVGRDLVGGLDERLELARLNLRAGRKAKSAAAFATAFDFLRTGVSLLPPGEWQSHYDLALALYTDAAEAAYLRGEPEAMSRYIEAVLDHARTVLDKVKAYEVKAHVYQAQNRLSEAVQTSLEILARLGITFPQEPSPTHIMDAQLETKHAIAGRSIEELLHLPPMKKPEKRKAMRIMSSISATVFYIAPVLLQLMTFKQVELSARHGNAPESAPAYALYGLIMCGIFDEIEEGYRAGQLALRILERFSAGEYRAKTLLIVYNCVAPWKMHVKETIPHLLDAYQSGLETGDLDFAALGANAYCLNNLFTGRELGELEREMASYVQAIANIRQETIMNFAQIHHQFVLNLLGRSEWPTRLVGEAYNETEMVPVHQAARDRTALMDVYVFKFMLSYLFEDIDQAFKDSANAQQYMDGATALILVPLFHFYASLTQLARYVNTTPAEQAQLLERVDANQERMRHWAEHAPMNHLHKYTLVEAERYRVLGEYEKARSAYDRAIDLAHANDYLNEEALAYELAGRFFLANGEERLARYYMQNAYRCYVWWGASAKVRQLEDKYPQLVRRIYQEDMVGTKVPPMSTYAMLGPALDLASILNASQILSGEIQLERLLEKMMLTMMENAGAELGIWIEGREDRFVIQAEAKAGEVTNILQAIPVEASAHVPLSILNYVARSKQPLALDDASQNDTYASDSYVQARHPKSVLCFPILHKDRLTDVIYLENNLSTGAFTLDRLQVLELLAAQAAISLENARLYATLENKVKERTLELQQESEHLEEMVKEMEKLSLHDPLTGLANRRLMEIELDWNITRARRYNHPFSIIMLDIDHFKKYNDTHGHLAGDRLLVEIANILLKEKRDADFVARYGGEEFLIILTETGAAEGYTVAERIRKTIEENTVITASLGAASYSKDISSIEDLICKADNALYRAKQKGRNRVEVSA